MQLLEVMKVWFLTLMEALPGRVGDQPGFLKRVKSVTPPQGIKIQGVYFLFGCYDAAILFEAPDFRTAKEFVLRVATPAVYKTETLAAIPVEEF